MRGGGEAYPVKGMGDLETEGIIDTDKRGVWGSGRSLYRVFKIGKREHRVMRYVDVEVGNESDIAY